MIYWKLYFIAAKITLMSFGGAYSIWAMMERELVVECKAGDSTFLAEPNRKPIVLPDYQKMTELGICLEEFNSVFGIGEVLPGPQINAIAILAFRNLGVAGMLLMIAGLISPGIVLFPFLLNLQNRWKNSFFWQNFLSGAVVATMAILVAFFLNLTIGLFRNNDLRSLVGVLLVASAFWASYSLRVNPFIIVVTGALAGYCFL